MQADSRNKLLKLVVISIGIILAWIVSAVQSGVAENIQSLGGTAYIYDIPLQKFWLKTECEIGENSIKILDEKAIAGASLKNSENYKFILINMDLGELDQNQEVKIRFINDLGDSFAEESIAFSNKEYIISIPAEGFNRFEISFQNMKGNEIIINKLEFRSSLELENKSELVIIFFVFFSFYIICTVLVSRLIRKKKITVDLYMPIKGIEILFGNVNSVILDKREKGISKSNKIYLSILTLIFFLMMFRMFTIPSYSEPFYGQLVITICILVFAASFIIGRKNDLISIQWNNPLAYSWFALAVLEIISEVLSGREYYFVGWARLFVFGLLFYVWGKKENRLLVLRAFSFAVRISFIVCLLWCIFVPNTNYSLLRYAGPFFNSNLFALYLILVFSVYISNIDECFENKKITPKIFINGAMLGACITLIWLTQCRSALLALIVIGVICLAKWLITSAFLKNRGSVIRQLIIVGVVVSAMHGITLFLMNSIAFKDAGYEVGMEIPKIHGALTMYAEASSESRIMLKFKTAKTLNEFTGGRLEIWADYLRNVGLIGKNKYKTFESSGLEMAVHNGIIAAMYNTGVFAVIPYVLLLFYSLKYACIYLKRNAFNKQYGMFPLAVWISFFFSAMFDIGDENPFYKSIWLAYYLIVGFLINMNNKNCESTICNVKYNTSCNWKKHKYYPNIPAVLGAVAFILLAGYIYKSNKIYDKLEIESEIKNIPFKVLGAANQNKWDDTNTIQDITMPQEIEGIALDRIEYNKMTYLYYINSNKELSLAVTENGINWFKYNNTILEKGPEGAFDDTFISEVSVVYVSPYFYMLYVGENAYGDNEVGLALSYDGINWHKQNIKGSIAVTNVKDIETEYFPEKEQLKVKYRDKNDKSGEFFVSVGQNRDMTGFDTETDWSLALVPSERVLQGSYSIEGEQCSKYVWMQKAASIDLYYNENAKKIVIDGYMPMESYNEKNVDEVNMKVKVDGEIVYQKTFRDSEVFEFDIPMNLFEQKSNLMHIELITDCDFNPKKIYKSSDSRDLSYMLYSIYQK